jgi:hypothetical protein
MNWLITVTAYADRDQSCNLYTLTETHNLGEQRPSPDTIRAMVQETKERFLESWPHRRNHPPTLVPVDVDILDSSQIEVHAES